MTLQINNKKENTRTVNEDSQRNHKDDFYKFPKAQKREEKSNET